MSAADLIALAERVEKAERPDRELDAAIYAAWKVRVSNITLAARPSGNRPGMVITYYEGGTHGTSIAPRFTASLDAAMTLVPEGREWRTRYCKLSSGEWAAIARIGEECGLNTSAATPALALTAAALRARAAQEGEKA